MKKLNVLLILIFLTLLVGCNNAKSDGTTVWRFVHEENNGSIQDVYVKEFAKKIEEKSNGKIDVEIYTVGQIGDATQQCELLQNGAVDFAIISPGNTGTIVPENQLFSLHFLFTDDMNTNTKILNESEALNIDLTNEYLDNNIKVLSYWTEGFQQWTTSKKVNEPEMWKGVKIRTMPSPMIVASYRAYGANPTPVPYMEVYSGLQLNMIEGQENPISAIEEMKFYEVQDYLTLANSNLYVTTTCVNPDFYEKMTDDEKQILNEVMQEMKTNNIEEKINGAALDKIKENSNITIMELTEEETEKYRGKAKSAYEVYKSLVGVDGSKILDKLIKEVNEIRNEE